MSVIPYSEEVNKWNKIQRSSESTPQAEPKALTSQPLQTQRASHHEPKNPQDSSVPNQTVNWKEFTYRQGKEFWVFPG